jgi:hypothetical protein
MRATTESRVAPQEIAPVGVQVRAAPLLASAATLDERSAERPLSVVQVRERVTVRPSHARGGCAHRAGGLDGTQEVGATVADGEAAIGVEPDLVVHLEPSFPPMFSFVHLGEKYHARS